MEIFDYDNILLLPRKAAWKAVRNATACSWAWRQDVWDACGRARQHEDGGG